MLSGVDISEYQHPDGAKIDYKLAVEKGVDFAIIEYRDESAGVNPYFEEDHAGFKAAGAVTGSYIFLRPDQAVAPQAEDLRSISQKFGPVWGDLEVNGGKNPRQLRSWWETLVSSSGPIGMVSYPSFLDHYGPFASTAPLWVDNFGAPKPPAFEHLMIWGTSQSARVPGIVANVDLDSWVGTRAQFESVFGKATTAKALEPNKGAVVGFAGTPSGKGYWICFEHGDVLAFGDAAYHGSPTLDAITVKAFMATPTGAGYRLIMSNLAVDSYGDARDESEVKPIEPS